FSELLIFLRRKTMINRKILTEADLLAFLKELQFPPLRVVEYGTEESRSADNRLSELDALLILAWGNRTYRFGVEARRLWTPKIISEAIDTVKRHLSLGEEGLLDNRTAEPLYPLILVPYLNEEWLLKLEARKVSGIDLCG